MIISDTIYYREDGTVSSVVRASREVYKSPASGKDVSEDVSAVVSIDEVQEGLGDSYGKTEDRIAALERQIADERTVAEETAKTLRDEKATLVRQLSDATARLAKVSEALR